MSGMNDVEVPVAEHTLLPPKQIWEVVSDYLRDKKVIRDVEPNLPKLKGVENNPGIVL